MVGLAGCAGDLELKYGCGLCPPLREEAQANFTQYGSTACGSWSYKPNPEK